MKKLNGNVQRQQSQQSLGSAINSLSNHTAYASKKISPGCFTQQFMLQDVLQEGNNDCRYTKIGQNTRQGQPSSNENVTTPWIYPQPQDPARQLTETISKQILTSLKANAYEKMDCFLRHKSSKNSLTNGEPATEEIIQKPNANACQDCGCPSASSLNGINSDQYYSNPISNNNTNYMSPQGSIGSSSSSSVGGVIQQASSSSQSSLKTPSSTVLAAAKPIDKIKQDQRNGISQNGTSQQHGIGSTRTGIVPKNRSVHILQNTNYQQNMQAQQQQQPKQAFYGEHHAQQDFSSLFPKSLQQTARDNFYERFAETADKPQTATLINHDIDQPSIAGFTYSQPFSAGQTHEQFYSQLKDDNQDGQNRNIVVNNNNNNCYTERKIRAHSHFTQPQEMTKQQNGYRRGQGIPKNLEYQQGALENQNGVIPLELLEERHQKQLDQFRLQAEHYDPRKLQWSVSENHTPRKPVTIDFQKFQKHQHYQPHHNQQDPVLAEDSHSSGISRKLESERKVSQDKIYQYQQDIQVYQAELLTVKRELESLQNQQTAVCDMNMLNAQLESLQNVFTDKKRQLEAEIEQSNQAHTHLKNKLQKANIQATSMKNIIENLTAQNTLLRQQLQKQQQQQQQTSLEQNQANERLKQGIDQRDQIIGEYEKRIEELNGKIEEFQGQQREFQETINEQKLRKIEDDHDSDVKKEQEGQQGQQYLMEIEELKKQIQKLSLDLKDSEEQRSGVNVELRQAKDELGQVKSTVQIVLSEKANITQELSATQISLENTKQQLSASEVSLGSSKQEIQNLREQFQRKQEELQSLQSENSRNNSEKQIIEDNLNSTVLALQAAQAKYESNQQEIDTLKQQVQRQQSDQQDLLDEKERLIRKKVEKEKRVDELVCENDKISELYDKAKAEVDALTLQLRGNEERNEEIERLNEEIRVAKADIEREKEAISKEREELDGLKEGKVAAENDSNGQMEILRNIEQEITERKGELKEIEGELEIQRKSLDAVKLQIEEGEQAYKILGSNHEQSLQQSQQQFADGEIIPAFAEREDNQGCSNNNTTIVSNSTSSNSNSQLPLVGSNRVSNSSSESIKHCCEGATQQQQCNACIKNTYRMQQYKEKKKQYRERLKASESKLCELQKRVKEETGALRSRIEYLEEEQKVDQTKIGSQQKKNSDGGSMMVKLEDKEKEIGNLKEEVRNLELRIVNLQVRNGQLERELEKTQRILGETQEKFKNVEEELRVCKIASKDVVAGKGKKSGQDDSDDELAEKDSEIESLEEDKKLLQEELTQKTNLIYEYMDAITALKKEIAKIQGDLSSKEELMKEKDKLLLEKINDKEKLGERCSEMHERNKELEETVEQLKEQLQAQQVQEQVAGKDMRIQPSETAAYADMQLSGQSSVRQSIGEEELRKIKEEFFKFEEALKTQLRGYQEDGNNNNKNDGNDGSAQDEMKNDCNSLNNDGQVNTLSKQELLESAKEQLALISKQIKQLQEEIAQSYNYQGQEKESDDIQGKEDGRTQEYSSTQQTQQMQGVNLSGKPLARARFLVSQTASSEDEEDQGGKLDTAKNQIDSGNSNQCDTGSSNVIGFDSKEKEDLLFQLEELKEACQLKEEKINRFVEESSQFSVKMSQREEEFNQQIEDNEAYYLKLLKRKNDEYSDLSKEYESLSDNCAALNDKIENLQKLQKQ